MMTAKYTKQRKMPRENKVCDCPFGGFIGALIEFSVLPHVCMVMNFFWVHFFFFFSLIFPTSTGGSAPPARLLQSNKRLDARPKAPDDNRTLYTYTITAIGYSSLSLSLSLSLSFSLFRCVGGGRCSPTHTLILTTHLLLPPKPSDNPIINSEPTKTNKFSLCHFSPIRRNVDSNRLTNYFQLFYFYPFYFYFYFIIYLFLSFFWNGSTTEKKALWKKYNFVYE